MFCAIDLFKQKTAYDLRISDWSSDVCSSDLWFLLPVYPLIDHWPLAAVWALLTLGPVVLLVLQWLVREIGRASRRESVCQYVAISVFAVTLKDKYTQYHKHHPPVKKH